MTGNNYKHLRDILKTNCQRDDNFLAFCDYGNTKITLDNLAKREYICKEYFIEKELCDILTSEEDYMGKVTFRGNTIITIKPLQEREKHLEKISKIINKEGKYDAVIAGFTSIDITKKGFTKALMLTKIIKKYNLRKNDVFFLGNELRKGNEEGITKIGISYLQINDVFECNSFIRVYNSLFCCKRGKKEKNYN